MVRGTSGSRRRFLKFGLAAITSAAVWPAEAKLIDHRRLSFENLHTGERLDAVYWVNGAYEPGALHAINVLLRDFRTGDVYPIDRKLLDLLVHLRTRLNSAAPVQVISGYRSPETNAMLASYSDGVAAGSLHMSGMAIDIRVPGRSLRSVHRVALEMAAGGVGYYPRSDFVHVDTGNVRRWG